MTNSSTTNTIDKTVEIDKTDETDKTNKTDKINKIEKLKKQRDVLNARIQKAEALEKSKERKNETRRKILVGAYYLDEAKKNSTMDEIVDAMKTYLTRKGDRVLFGLDVDVSEPSTLNDQNNQNNQNDQTG